MLEEFIIALRPFYNCAQAARAGVKYNKIRAFTVTANCLHCVRFFSAE
jgi:hypothetical protein